MAYLKNILRLLPLIASSLNKARKQRQFMKHTVSVDVEEVKKLSDGSLNDRDLQKINLYYGIGVPSIIGECYCFLRDHQMTTEERTAISYLGALTGLFDDFFDEKRTPHTRIRAMIESPQSMEGNDAHEQLFLNFYRKALEHLNGNAIKEMFFEVFEAQVFSKEQELEGITEQRIQEITFLKGGFSLLFYRVAIDLPLEGKEREILYSAGEVGQMANDIFDVYKDREAGIQTLVTTANSIDELRQLYTQMMNRVFDLVHQSHFSKKGKRNFLQLFAMGMAGRAFVALDFLKEQEATSGGVFKVHEYERKQLICDMEKPKNILKFLDYHARFKFD